MKRTHGLHVKRDDRLHKSWWDPERQCFYTQGKRVGRDCPLTKDERYIYTSAGPVEAVKFIRDTRQVSLAEAKRLLDTARSPAYLFGRRVA